MSNRNILEKIVQIYIRYNYNQSHICQNILYTAAYP